MYMVKTRKSSRNTWTMRYIIKQRSKNIFDFKFFNVLASQNFNSAFNKGSDLRKAVN